MKKDKEYKNRLKSRMDESIRTSNYIAALDRFFNYRGFIYPLVDEYNGKFYRFELCHAESRMLFKFLRDGDESLVEQYENYKPDRNVQLVVDLAGVASCDDNEMILDMKAYHILCATLAADPMFYFDGRFWEQDESGCWVALLTADQVVSMEAIKGVYRC